MKDFDRRERVPTLRLLTTELPIVEKIARRAAFELGVERGFEKDLSADIVTAVHSNGCPLDLMRLLNSTPRDFAYDMAGMKYELDYVTYKLNPRWKPRCALGIIP